MDIEKERAERDFKSAVARLAADGVGETLTTSSMIDIFNSWLATDPLDTRSREALYYQAVAYQTIAAKIKNIAAMKAAEDREHA